MVKLNETKYCNFCENVARYNGRVKGGTSWAYMCDDHFGYLGVGLGIGKGQKLTYDMSTVDQLMDATAEDIERSSEPFYFSGLDSTWDYFVEELPFEWDGSVDKGLIGMFIMHADLAEGYTKHQVIEWAKERHPKLFE